MTDEDLLRYQREACEAVIHAKHRETVAVSVPAADLATMAVLARYANSPWRGLKRALVGVIFFVGGVGVGIHWAQQHMEPARCVERPVTPEDFRP